MELLLLSAIALVLLPAMRPRLSVPSLRFSWRWGGLFLAGAFVAVANLPAYLLLQGDSLENYPHLFTPQWALASGFYGGLRWLIAGYLLSRWTRGFSLWAQMLVAWLLANFVGQANNFLAYHVSPVSQDLPVTFLPQWDEMVSQVTTYPAVLLTVVRAFLLSWLSRALSAPQVDPAQTSVGGSYGGVPMSDEMSDSTRYLAAAAYRGTQNIGERLLDKLNSRGRAVAPELGLDLRLIAEVAQYAHHRNLKWQLLYAFLGLLCFVSIAADVAALAVLLVLVAAGIWFFRDLNQTADLKVYFSREGFTPSVIRDKFTRPLTAGQIEALPEPDANLTVYGGFSPFLGTGIDFGGWSFVVALDKGKEGVTPRSFQLEEIYSAVSAAIARLYVAGAEQRDHFFVQGQDVRTIQEILPDAYGRPCQRLSDESVQRYRQASDPRVRHYRWIRVRDWGGDIVFSYFLRCSVRGPTLFVEVKRFLLTPLQSAVRDVDNLGKPPVEETLSKLVGAPFSGFFSMIFAPFQLFSRMAVWVKDAFGGPEGTRRSLIDANPRYDYGATTTIRQTLASNEYQHYFQRADSDYYQKIIEKEALDTLVEFLDAHGIDTSDLKDRQSTILNHGVIVQGGNIEAGSLSVGQGSKSVQNTVKKFTGKARAVAGGKAS
jgi:hypothetical protein